MKIRQIISKRKLSKFYFYQNVFEWEDELAKQMDVPVECIPKSRFWQYIFKLILVCLRKKSVVFYMSITSFSRRVFNRGNIIPCVIDYYTKEEKKREEFYNRFSRNPVVLISSLEVFEYLKSVGCPLNIRHWALSIPDKHITPPTPIYFLKKSMTCC